MDCTLCKAKSCRTVEPCKAAEARVDPEEILENYHRPENQGIVQAAAALVDGGRAGTLSRLDEISEFAKAAGYKRLGVAYCYGLEREAAKVVKYLKGAGHNVSGVSCTAGSLSQNQVNSGSELPGVSCNPLSQAEVLNADGVDLAAAVGLCMGHDILFQRQFRGDVTTLLVKDRTVGHNMGDFLRDL